MSPPAGAATCASTSQRLRRDTLYLFAWARPFRVVAALLLVLLASSALLASGGTSSLLLAQTSPAPARKSAADGDVESVPESGVAS